MATTTDLAVEAQATALLAQLAPLQTGAFGAGSYWQGLPTHLTPPKGGATKSADSTKTPTDQAKGWTAIGVLLPPNLAAAYSVTIYDGPLGKGYELVAVHDEGSTRHVRIWNVGPETWRTQGPLLIPLP